MAKLENKTKENLCLYLIDKPRTPVERQQNKETLDLATKIRAEREQEFKESMLGYRLKKDRTVRMSLVSNRNSLPKK